LKTNNFRFVYLVFDAFKLGDQLNSKAKLGYQLNQKAKLGIGLIQKLIT